MLSATKKENIKRGVEKYQLIMKMYDKFNVSKDKDFQRLYNGFYRVAHRPKDWYLCYYRMLEGLKTKNRTFKYILRKLHKRTGRLEASFSSKMYHTRNPDSPIIDKWVLKNMGLRLPLAHEDNRIEKTVQLYDNLIKRYKDLALSDEGKEYVERFNKICPNTKITKVKKIDFILWQIGRRGSM